MMPAYERIGSGPGSSAAETAETRARIRGFWHRSDDARGSPAARYLASRGLPWLAGNPSIRYRPDCAHPSGVRCGAMIALIWGADGDIAAVHRTFLSPDGTKANVNPTKASWGSFAGGAIRLDPAGPELAVGEGLESSAAAGHLLELPAWSAIACGNLGWSLVLPPVVRSVVIAVDADDAGRKAARAAARRWRAEGREVRFAVPSRPGADFADLLREGAA